MKLVAAPRDVVLLHTVLGIGEGPMHVSGGIRTTNYFLRTVDRDRGACRREQDAPFRIPQISGEGTTRRTQEQPYRLGGCRVVDARPNGADRGSPERTSALRAILRVQAVSTTSPQAVSEGAVVRSLSIPDAPPRTTNPASRPPLWSPEYGPFYFTSQINNLVVTKNIP